MNGWLIVAAGVIAVLVTAWLQAGGRHIISLDEPAERSLHSLPTPRTGGIAIVLGLLPTVAFAFLLDEVRWLLVGLVLVFLVSLADDARSLPFWIRLPVHLLAAACAVTGSGIADGSLLATGMVVLGIAWGTNLFNFMDGMDGLAGSMSLVGGSALSISFAMQGAYGLAVIPAAAAASSAGFLAYNLPPARIFMGDAGSATLGYLFSAVSVHAVTATVVPYWLPLLIFLPFVADATLTLICRAFRRQPVWRAHREHLYQRLVLSGVTVRRTLLYYILAMSFCGAAANLMLEGAENLGTIVLAATGGLAMIAYWSIMTRRT